MKSPFIPLKYNFIRKNYNKSKFNLLDIGCGNHAVKDVKRWFPLCDYYGLDRGIYNNDSSDFELMKYFYQIDLSASNLDLIPNTFFDVIILSHVIEHLYNGLDVILALQSKLKTGGKIYIEFPSVRSLSFPNMYGTLNFCDDSSHVMVYDLREIANILLKNGFRIIRGGVKRDWARVLYGPFAFIIYRIITGRIFSVGLWDLLGFADFIWAEKISSSVKK